jgi:hypothetical protein
MKKPASATGQGASSLLYRKSPRPSSSRSGESEGREGGEGRNGGRRATDTGIRSAPGTGMGRHGGQNIVQQAFGRPQRPFGRQWRRLAPRQLAGAMAAIIGRQDPHQHTRLRMAWTKSEPFCGGECLDQIVPDLSAAPIVIPSREMQIGFQRQLDSASDELEEVFARMRIARRDEVACSGKETDGIVEEILPPPACGGAAHRRGRMTGRGG